MFLPVQAKVCGLTRPGDVLAARTAGADYFGFVLYPESPRRVERESFAAISAPLPGGSKVMVDVNPAADELEARLDWGFDYFQIHFDLDAPTVSVATWSGLVGRERLWLAPRIPPGETFPELALEFADTFLIDAYSASEYGGSGRRGDWKHYRDLRERYPEKRFILAGGLSPENIAEAVAATGAQLVDVSSGLESAPGQKDPERIRDFFQALRQAG